MQKKLSVTSSPHLRSGATSKRIMIDVCLALLPAGIAGIILFGAGAAKLIVVSVVSCVLAEFLYQKLTGQKVTVSDFSAVVTGLLLAYNLPADAPIWIPVVGSVVAIILVKQIFGGLGSNFMNPALTARAVLFVSWASIMTSYPATRYMTDAVSGATPLGMLSNGTPVNLMDLLLDQVLGSAYKVPVPAAGGEAGDHDQREGDEGGAQLRSWHT